MESTRYFTGKPCKRGHVAERFRSNRSCVECHREKTIRKSNRPLYQTWKLMIGRCHRPGDYGYSKYGAKGIRVCDRWRKYVNFYADMGDKPQGTTLDRIDGSKGYSPENCRWATYRDQARNRSNTVMIEYGGEALSISDLANKHGVRLELLRQRLALGWSLDDALAFAPHGRKMSHRNSAKTHCKNGHELSGENLYVRQRGSRECRTCIRQRQSKEAA